jgi:hypothetical protein
MFCFGLPLAAATVQLEPSRDATLIQDPAGALANGSGPNFFVGHNNQLENGVRRALVRFDVASVLPPRAIIDEVSLSLSTNPGNPAPRSIRIHRVLADWGEGASSASGGGGGPAGPGDVTWIHTFWDTMAWVHEGGQFVARPSGEVEIGDADRYMFASSPHLIQDVRLWAHNPAHNFGWILIGDESTQQTVKSIASRETDVPERRPLLEIRYRLPGSFY